MNSFVVWIIWLYCEWECLCDNLFCLLLHKLHTLDQSVMMIVVTVSINKNHFKNNTESYVAAWRWDKCKFMWSKIKWQKKCPTGFRFLQMNERTNAFLIEILPTKIPIDKPELQTIKKNTTDSNSRVRAQCLIHVNFGSGIRKWTISNCSYKIKFISTYSFKLNQCLFVCFSIFFTVFLLLLLFEMCVAAIDVDCCMIM